MSDTESTTVWLAGPGGHPHAADKGSELEKALRRLGYEDCDAPTLGEDTAPRPETADPETAATPAGRQAKPPKPTETASGTE